MKSIPAKISFICGTILLVFAIVFLFLGDFAQASYDFVVAVWLLDGVQSSLDSKLSMAHKDLGDAYVDLAREYAARGNK